MANKDMSPEIALTNTLNKIEDVLHSVTKFMDSYTEETFEGADYTKFRNNGEKTKKYWSSYYYRKTSEYVTLQTLRNYGVVTIISSRTEEIITQPVWNSDYCYRLNNGKVIDDYNYGLLCSIFDDADRLFEIEQLKGTPVTAQIYTYKINKTRLEQLQNIANTLQKIITAK